MSACGHTWRSGGVAHRCGKPRGHDNTPGNERHSCALCWSAPDRDYTPRGWLPNIASFP